MQMLILSLLMLLVGLPGIAQDCPHFDRLMRTADSHWQNGEFDKALNQLAAAREYCPELGLKVDEKLLAFTRDISSKYEEVKRERSRAEKALEETSKAYLVADSLYQKAETLVNAFYFYAGRFALAYGTKKYGRNVYYFIDENGIEVEKLGQWVKADQFNENGFARVRTKEEDKLVDYLIDTSGYRYKVAYSVNDLDESIIALDLSGKNLRYLPDELYLFSQLQLTKQI